MTYLDAVNSVLRRLREREVPTVEASSYSKLIGMLVNDAKREVEDAWQWSAVRDTLTATTEDGTFSYILTGSGNRPTVLEVLNDTTNLEMHYRPSKWFTEKYLFPDNDVPTGSPIYYTFNGLDSNGDTIMEFYPKPDGVYQVRINLVLRQPELANDSDEFYVPAHVVAQLAYAKAVEERGEDGGVMSSSAYMTAQRSLADAISLDAAKHPEEIIWQEV